MKKLFFVALMAGIFGFQSLSAQDTFTIVHFQSDTNLGTGTDLLKVYSEESTLCFDDYTVVNTNVFVYNGTNNTFTINGGNSIPIAVTAQAAYTSNFGRTVELFFQATTSGRVKPGAPLIQNNTIN